MPSVSVQVFPFQKDALSFAAWCNASLGSGTLGSETALHRLQRDLQRVNFQVCVWGGERDTYSHFQVRETASVALI